MVKQQDLLLKIIIIGNTYSGKSSLVNKYVDNIFFDDGIGTIGIDFKVKSINYLYKNTILNIKLQIWDTAGQETFKSLVRQYYKGALGALVVFDLTNRESYDQAINMWIPDINNIQPDCKILLVGNKSDMNKVILDKEIQTYCNNNNINYIETSVKNNNNVNETFKLLIDNIIENGIPENKDYHAITLTHTQQESHHNNYKYCIKICQ